MMDYFNVVWDDRISNAIEPIDLSQTLNKEIMHDMKKAKILSGTMLHFYLHEKQTNFYPDFLDNPVPVVSDKLKCLLEKFEPSIVFIPLAFVDFKSMKQDTYWGMVPVGVDCLSPKSEFHKNGTIKRLVIDSIKMTDKPRVFRVQGIMENLIIVELTVAEALLRRDFTGIELKKTDIDN